MKSDEWQIQEALELVKNYRCFVIGICGLLLELLAIGSFLYHAFNEGILLVLFGLTLIPIGFMVERLDVEIDRLKANRNE